MTNSEWFRERATACAKRARDAKDDTVRRTWQDTAAEWLRLADMHERQSHVRLPKSDAYGGEEQKPTP
jgi:hypothetical protein